MLIFWSGWALVVLASLAHAWWSCNASSDPIDRPFAFHDWSGRILLGVVGALLVGLGLIWAAAGPWLVLLAIALYFFVFPLVNLPFLDSLELIPSRKPRR